MSFARYVGMFGITDPQAEALLRHVGWAGGAVSTGYYASAASLLHRGLNDRMRAENLTLESIRAWTLGAHRDQIFRPWFETLATTPTGPQA